MPTQYLDEQEELVEAVKRGREERVRALLACGACRVDSVDKEGRTPLHWACQYGHLPTVCLLLSHYMPPTTSSNRSCPRCGRSSSTNYQRQQGAGHNCSAENYTIRPSHMNVYDNNHFPAESSVIVEDVSCPDDVYIGQEALEETRHITERNGNRSSGAVCQCDMKMSYSQGKHVGGTGKEEPRAMHVVNVRDMKGQTALHVACNYRRADVASFLTTLPSCDVNAVDRVGNTPLHRAIHAGLHTLACLLCDVGADVRAANGQLWTPLHEAIRCGSEDVIRTLLSRGCDVNAVTSSVAATTPFLTAIFYFKISLRTSDYGKGLDSILRLLIESGCKLSEGDYQWTPLSASIDIDKSFIASLLLFNGCRFQRSFSASPTNGQRAASKGGSRNVYCRSLLVEAFTRCEPYVVRLLVMCGYQPNLEEVEQCSRRIPSFSPLFYRISRSEHVAMRGKAELLDWLRQRACTPLSLMELSRTAVRLALNHAAFDTSILKRLQKLPLPTTLRHYLTLSDFTDNLMTF